MGKSHASPSALSIASSALEEPVVAAVVGGVALTIATAVFAYQAYEKYEEKKHKEAIEEVNRLHKRYLEKIVIAEYDDIKGFPEIFKISEKDGKHVINCLRYTDDEIWAIANTLPHGSDIALSLYRESILAAILKLKEFYFIREDRHDVVSGVVSYLLNMLETKCLNFQGYEYDIAYVDAIGKFIGAYASLKESENTQKFSRLAPVYSYLLEAKQYLEEHKEALSLEELVAELRDSCANSSSDLLRKLVKMVIPAKYADLSETVSIDELSRNLLRRQYIRSAIGGIEVWSDGELHIPESVFKEWISGLAAYYLKSLKPISSLKQNDIITADALLSFTQWSKGVVSLDGHASVKREDKHKLHESLDNIRSVFKHSPNFINTKLDTTSKRQKFIVVTEDKEVLERTEMISKCAHLIHSIISLQYLCTHLLKSIKQLGDLYVQDPQHCRDIFETLCKLCNVIKKGVVDNRTVLTTIEKANLNTMRLSKEQLFPGEIKAILEVVEAVIDSLNARITEYRTKLTKPANEAIEEVNYEMHTVAAMISAMYPNPEESPEWIAAAKKQQNLTTTGVTTTSSVVKNPVPTSMHRSKEVIHSRGITNVTDLKPTKEMKPIKKAEIKSTMSLIHNLHSLTSQICSKISDLQKTRDQDPRIERYKKIYHSLNVMQNKSVALLEEKDKSIERSDKAFKTSALTETLCQKYLDFLSRGTAPSGDEESAFASEMHEELVASEHDFIDWHNGTISKFMNNYLCCFGLFRTDTRKKLEVLEAACLELAV